MVIFPKASLLAMVKGLRRAVGDWARFGMWYICSPPESVMEVFRVTRTGGLPCLDSPLQASGEYSVALLTCAATSGIVCRGCT